MLLAIALGLIGLALVLNLLLQLEGSQDLIEADDDF
jgi:hypothetical protein